MAKNKETETIHNTEQAAPATEPADAGRAETVSLTKEEFEQVKAHIETLQKEKEEAIALAQRLQADFDNYRKRNATLRADSFDDGIRDCIKELLPTLDNFDRALDNAEGVDPGFLEGMKLIQRTLMDALQKQGLSQIPADGKFDPNLHNAVMQQQEEGKEEGDILEVFQKGYEVRGRILRHTMVKVAQ